MPKHSFFMLFKTTKLMLMVAFLMLVLLSGCTHTLVEDDTYHDNDEAAHCAGSEWADDSTLAVLPIPGP